MRKINLGSGPVSARGWKNYDWGLLPFLGKYRLTSIFVKLGLLDKSYDWKWCDLEMVDIRGSLPDMDESVNYIYCSHVLEHFERKEALKILKDCKRVLKRNGRLRIVLPDLKKMIVNYKNAETFNREFFGYDKDQYVGLLGNIKKNFIRGHQWMYDVDSAKKLLMEAGFKNINVSGFKKGKFPDLEKLDLEQHQNISLYLEAESRL